MSGHSKWHNIQAKKGKADAARGKIFTKLGRELLIAVKEGGPDPAGNSKLKNVIAKCKAANMPNDTINNAIKKAQPLGFAIAVINPCNARFFFDTLKLYPSKFKAIFPRDIHIETPKYIKYAPPAYFKIVKIVG